MKKGLIIYSSQNGSTRKVAGKIASGLSRNGYQIDVKDINQTSSITIDHYDFLGIGSPVYMFRPSYVVLDFIDTLDDISGKPVFTFVTFGSEIGDGANWLRQKLAKRRAIDLGHFQCHGKHLFPGYTDRGYIFSPNSPSAEELFLAESFGENIALKLTTHEADKPSAYDKGAHVVLRFERFVTNRFIVKLLYSYFFSAKKERCNSCGTCIKACPTLNITKLENNRPQWGRACILCCNCQIQCPQQAIKTPISWFIFKPFLSYNILRTKNHGIPFSPAEKEHRHK
jgi:flavodoxin/ferredoxin